MIRFLMSLVRRAPEQPSYAPTPAHAIVDDHAIVEYYRHLMHGAGGEA